MLQNIKIELLKIRRTHTFLILFVIMIIASLWQLFAINSELSHSNLRNIAVFYNNQTVDCLILPIMVSIFASKIISNEKEGQTFKLQQSNGTEIYRIFLSKILLMVSTSIVLFVMEVAFRYVYASINGIHTSVMLLLLFLIGQVLTVFSLICIFLVLSLLLNKQGIVLAIGFLFGFLGTVMASRSQSILSFWLPGIGNAYLAPYKYHLIDNAQLSYEYTLDQYLPVRLLIYILFCLLIYMIARMVIRRKEISLI